MTQGDTVSVVKAAYKSAWGDGDIAYVATMPVDRNNNKTEYYKVTYKFDNITFVKDSLTTTTDWADATNGVRNLSQAKLNMTDYNCLVVGNDANSKSLLVNSGDFDSIFKDSTNLKWNGGTALTAIDTLICKVALTEAQQKRLAKFTNLKYIQLDETTSLAKGALNSTDLDYINMPKVATIAEGFSAAITPSTVLLPAYKFDVKEVNDALITAGLKKLDMSAVEKIEETFYAPCALSFAAATNLEEVKIKNNLKVEVPNLFMGCNKLAKVDGIIDITNAPGIFQNVDSLVTVNITGTVIPERAFYTSATENSRKTKLANVLVDSVQVIPTSIGANAFYGCAAMTTMDLKNTTTIGDYAFSLSGLTKPSNSVALMTVGAATIGDLAFSGTKLTQVDFVNATSIGDGILYGVNTVGAIQFQKAFTVDETRTSEWKVTGFGSTTTLYVANGQKYVEGNTLKLPYVNVTGATPTTDYTTYYFTTIKVAAAK